MYLHKTTGIVAADGSVEAKWATGGSLLEVHYDHRKGQVDFIYSAGYLQTDLVYTRRYKLVTVGGRIPEGASYLRYFPKAEAALYDVTNHRESILKEVEEVFTKAGISYKIYQNMLITSYGQYDLFTGKFQVGEHRGVGIYTFINRNRDCVSTEKGN